MMKLLLSMNDLSSKEQAAVRELKKRMDGCLTPELLEDLDMFVRFLRARDLNLNAAEAMLRKHLDWRKLFQTDTILEIFKAKEVIKKYVTINLIGSDKEGSPILYFHFGKIDSRGILKSVRKIEVVKYVVCMLETAVGMLKEESEKRGKHLNKWTILINLDGLSLSVATHKETITIISQLIVMYEGNYPERLKTAYCINASPYFTMLFNVVKHFISGPTYKKINIFSKEGWQDEIVNLIDPEVLPAFLGGKRTDPDGNPLCLTFITHGGRVPESYYVNKKANTLANVPNTKKILLTRKSKCQLTLDVTEPGTHIEWEFETTHRDIGFSLLYKANLVDNCLMEVIPKQRIETDVSSECGMMKCERPGIYVIEFDNSYSWMFQKEIYYKVSLVKNAIELE